VDPLLGTERDFDRLVEGCHERGIRVILDLVMNHTSDRHPWFLDSRQSRDSAHADWYIWRDPAGYDATGRPIPPNNWVSWFGGGAWEYEPQRGQFYHHTFLRQQPELDWRHPAVEAAQFAMVRGWLERGVDGFRLDTFNVFLKDREMRSNPRRRGRTAWTRQVHLHDFDQPELAALIGRFRAILDRKRGRMSVGELFVGTTEGAAALTEERHLVFDWELITRPWSAGAFRAAILRRERAFGDARWPTIVLSNHDQPRHASRLAASIGDGPGVQDAIAKAAAVMSLTMRGTPFLYYGEELGSGDVAVPPDESIDEPARHVTPDFPWWDRSQARTPMPWSGEPGAGFSTGRPWLRFAPDVATRNVAAESADPDSVLSCYRRMLSVRRRYRSLQDGEIALLRSIGDPTVLGYRRTGDGPEALVLIAFGPGSAVVSVPEPERGRVWRPVVGTHLDLPDALRPGTRVTLRPFEAVVSVASRT
ncbi:MAG TPA: alpha-amylase family glycosyl hydrolase, partial [Candidatus Bathyarchaeia archaeon]|nr:alpha-amylase family glycosyl hydrolase [Candidatus Bathyarchaeia archaeon]